ncbi:hypothetical protein BFW01_g624 [Lasiodiplodia theobromae]|nr:hypothetical protein BFW01_g624 [Lasiodiplodia theobromae]
MQNSSSLTVQPSEDNRPRTADSMSSGVVEQLCSLSLNRFPLKDNEEPYYPSIRPTRTLDKGQQPGKHSKRSTGPPELWGDKAWTRCQAHDADLQSLLVYDFVDPANGVPTHVLLVPDEQPVKICADRYDMMMMLYDDLECVDWHDFVSEVKKFIVAMDGAESSFRSLRLTLIRRVAALTRDADSNFDMWQRDMIRLDHLCQLFIVDTCDVLEPPSEPAKPSLIRRLTTRICH